MNKVFATLISTLIVGGLSLDAYAAKRPIQAGNINKSIIRDTPKGTFTRTMEQRRTDNGFTREHRVTTPDGRTAERFTRVTNDRENRTRVKEVSGTRLNGNSYSGDRTTTRTDSGFEQSSNRTNHLGQTATSHRVVDIDRDAGTRTSTTTATGFNGETRTVTKTVSRTVTSE